MSDSSNPGELRVAPCLSVRVGVRQYFAGEHLWAARFMALRCREREDQLHRGNFKGVDYEVRSFALTAIMESVAFLEAAINEVWQGILASTSDSAARSRLPGLSDEILTRLQRELGSAPQLDRSLSTLAMYNLVLLGAGQPRLDTSQRPGQDVVALIPLRNALMHYKPETHWTDQKHPLEKQLAHLVPANPLMEGSKPWFPHHVLSAGVAEWAWKACHQLTDQWQERLGFDDIILKNMPPWPDEEPRA